MGAGDRGARRDRADFVRGNDTDHVERGILDNVQGHHPRLGAGTPHEITVGSCVDCSHQYAGVPFLVGRTKEDTEIGPEGRHHHRSPIERGSEK